MFLIALFVIWVFTWWFGGCLHWLVVYSFGWAVWFTLYDVLIVCVLCVLWMLCVGLDLLCRDYCDAYLCCVELSEDI